MKTAAQFSDFLSEHADVSRLFSLDSDRSEEVSVVWGGFERCRPDSFIKRGKLPCYILEFVSIGSGSMELNDAHHELQPGSFYLYGPSAAPLIKCSTVNPLGKYFVGIECRGAEAFLRHHGLAGGSVVKCQRGEPVRRSFDMLIDRALKKSPLAASICSLIARQLLLMLKEGGNPEESPESTAFATYQRARGYMERNFLELRTQESTAKACGLNAPSLCRLFSRYHDESPYQYLTRLRMDHAACLLLKQGSTVKSVASIMGFKDPCHFSRVFKSVHDVPPSRFRHSLHPQWSG